jgi:hypothetical protein
MIQKVPFLTMTSPKSLIFAGGILALIGGIIWWFNR